jgi:hypothetical protein
MLLRLVKPIKTQERNKVVYIIGNKRFTYNLKKKNVSYLYPTFKELIDEFGLKDFQKRFKFFLVKVIGIEVKRINGSNYFSNFETKNEFNIISKMTNMGYTFLESTWMSKISSIMTPHIKKRIANLSKVDFEHIVNGNRQDFIFTDLDSIDIPQDSIDIIPLGDGNNITVITPFFDSVTRNTPIITIIDDKIFLNDKDIFFKSILNKLGVLVSNKDSLDFLRKYFYEYFTKYIK